MTAARSFSSPAESTSANAVEGGAGVQQQFRLFGGATYRAVLLDTDSIRACANEREVFDLSCREARVRHTQGWYADQLGVDRGQFSKMLNGTARFAVNPSELAALTGNLALAQFYALQVGCDLGPHVVTERERLEALERKAAMWDQEHGGK